LENRVQNSYDSALYMRVSTKGHGQTTETQALALRDYAAHRGFEIIGEYREKASAVVRIPDQR